MAKAVYIGERPASWGPIGTMIVINNRQRLFEHEAEEPTAEQPKVTQPETTTPTTPEPATNKPTDTADVAKTTNK